VKLREILTHVKMTDAYGFALGILVCLAIASWLA